ncbi:hypothetical protein VNO80_19641 [Phaseolus coccineus]|uniref:Uncharacterized protein n=1 Tax=Phaseolus coccineus TaxID=3886 RepID=A0AAN9QZZ5_PHACN
MCLISTILHRCLYSLVLRFATIANKALEGSCEGVVGTTAPQTRQTAPPIQSLNLVGPHHYSHSPNLSNQLLFNSHRSPNLARPSRYNYPKPVGPALESVGIAYRGVIGQFGP